MRRLASLPKAPALAIGAAERRSTTSFHAEELRFRLKGPAARSSHGPVGQDRATA
jgi:hypothetical protein